MSYFQINDIFIALTLGCMNEFDARTFAHTHTHIHTPDVHRLDVWEIYKYVYRFIYALLVTCRIVEMNVLQL